MGQILKFPVQATKFGYKRVRKRARAEDPNQLHLFERPAAQILNLTLETSWFEQALTLDELGDDRAREFYAKAVAEQDCVADAWCNLGIIESRKGNTAKAFDCFTASLKQDPRHSVAHYNLGNLYFDANDLRLAQVHYEIAAEMDPSFANVHFNLALVQAIRGDHANAVSTLVRYQELAPEPERRNVDELLHNLKRSLTSSDGFQFNSR